MQNAIQLLQQARQLLQWTRAYQLTKRNASFEAPSAHEPCRLPVPVPVPVRRPMPRVMALAGAVLFAAALSASVPALAVAQDWNRDDWNWSRGSENIADGRLVDVQVMVQGDDAPLFFAPGRRDRWYFEAFHGRNYSLRVRNNTGRRVGVLIAVDGLNVVNGEMSQLRRDEPMYVLDPYESATINGWRTSLNEIRRFVFVDEQRSYAERTGQANGDMGWVRVLSFREAQPWRGWYQQPPQIKDERRPYGSREEGEEAAPAPPTQDREGQKSLKPEEAPRAQGYAPPAPSPGTGWGDRRYDPVTRTHFVAENRPTDQLILRYEYESGLRALGIYPRGDRLWDRERGELGFAKPPRW